MLNCGSIKDNEVIREIVKNGEEVSNFPNGIKKSKIKTIMDVLQEIYKINV